MNADQFWAAVDRRGGDECWPWLASNNGNGRGRIRFNGRNQYAYRVAWELTHGEPAPGDLLVCHHCDNPVCVRPDHLFVGTVRDNSLDMMSKGRGYIPTPILGEGHHSAVASDEVVREVRERYARGGIAPCELAVEYGISPSTMSNWLRGRVRLAAGGPVVDRLVSEVRHGTYTSYSKNVCRCGPCVEAGRAYSLDYRRRVAAKRAQASNGQGDAA